MSELGRGAAVVDALRDIAGPELYRRNAFRVTGMATDAGGRAIRAQRQKLTTAMSVAPVSGVDATSDEVQAAFADLGDARRRLVHEMFWLWGDTNACGCPASLHNDHDDAVRAHAEALDMERAGSGSSADGHWQAAADLWSSVLRRVAFWEHLRHRMQALDDKRLDESSIDALRDALPRALVAPAVALAAKAQEPSRLVAHAARWDLGERVVAGLLEEAAEPALRNVEASLDHAGAMLDNEDFHATVARVQQVVPELDRLKQLLPGNRDVAVLRNRAATLCNNSAVAVGRQRVWEAGAGAVGNESAQTARSWLHLAMRLTEDPESHRTYESNLADLEASERLRRELAPFGVTQENAAQRVRTLMEAGRLDEARALLQVMRRYTTDREEAAQIDQLLSLIAGLRHTAPRYRPSQVGAPANPAPARPWGVIGAIVLLSIFISLWANFGPGVAVLVVLPIVCVWVLLRAGR